MVPSATILADSPSLPYTPALLQGSTPSSYRAVLVPIYYGSPTAAPNTQGSCPMPPPAWQLPHHQKPFGNYEQLGGYLHPPGSYTAASTLLAVTQLPPPSWQLHSCLHPPGRYTAASTLLAVTQLPPPSWQLHSCLHPPSHYTAASTFTQLPPPPGSYPLPSPLGSYTATPTSRQLHPAITTG